MSLGRRVPDDYSRLERLAERYFYFAIAYIGVPMSMLRVFAELGTDGLSFLEALHAATTPTALVFYLLGPPTFRYRAAVATMLALAVGTIHLLDLGPVFSAAAVFATTIAFAALFVGRRLAVAAFGWLVLALVASIALSGVEGYSRLFPDGLAAGDWVRIIVGSVVAFLFLMLISWAAFREQQAALDETRDALAMARAERHAREQAQDAAERAQRLEALGRLAGGVAHDFNNALAVVLSNAELLTDGRPAPEEVQALARGIVNASKTAQTVVGQLAAFSRNPPALDAACSPARVVEDMREPIRRLLPADVSIRVHNASSRWVPLGQPQLEQILLNLLINSRDALPDGGGCICFHTRDVEGKTGGVELVVSDDGVGMAPETLARAFEPFFTTKSPERGTGLGLSIIHGLVTGVGGELCLDSEPGRGTSVHIWLPSTAAPSAVETPENRTTSSFSGRALLVEDQEDVREALERLLARLGFEVTSRPDGDAAIADMPNDCMLLCTDAVMPGASAHDVIDAFLAANPSGRVLVCSGHLDEELQRRGLQGERYAFLAKPFTRGQLADVLNTLLTPDAISARSAEA